MIIIRPTFWRRRNTISVIVIGAICLSGMVFRPSAPSSLLGLAAFVGLALVVWLAWRSVRLEITETKVRADEGAARGPMGSKEAFRSRIRSIHYAPKAFSFRGADGQSLIEASTVWTLQDMVRAAEVLGVPLYDDRVGLARPVKAGTGAGSRRGT
jgi:threonine/homoserine/homoserine lactone efflux protein